MYCMKCGRQLNDDAKFCPGCGSLVTTSFHEESSEMNEVKDQPNLNIDDQYNKNEHTEDVFYEKKKHKKGKKTLLVILSIVILAILVSISFFFIKNKIPLSNGMSQEEANEIVEQGKKYYGEGDYAAALEYYLQLPEDSLQYKQSSSIIDEAKKKYVEMVIEEANQYIENKDYSSAMESLEKSTELLPDNSQLEDKYKEISDLADSSEIVSKALSEASSFAALEDYKSAITTIDEALKKLEDSDELTAKREEYADQYKSVLKNSAYEAYKNDGYESAVSILKNGKKVLGDDEELVDLIQQYKDCAPVTYLSMVDRESGYYVEGLEGTFYNNSNEIYDCQKNLRTNVVSYSFDTVSTKIKLNGEFVKATGTFFYFLEYNDKSLKGTLRIWADSDLIYDSSVTANDSTKDFELDLENVIYLTVEMTTGTPSFSYESDGAFAGVSQFNFYKNAMD